MTRRKEGPCSEFVGGYEIDPEQPTVCQTCGWLRHDHSASRIALGTLYVRAKELRDAWPEGGCLVDPACGNCTWCKFYEAVDACAVAPTLEQALAAREERIHETAASVKMTPREFEVLSEVAGGYSNRAIGKRLKISEHTAKFHANNLLLKFSARNRTHMVMLAFRAGLVK